LHVNEPTPNPNLKHQNICHTYTRKSPRSLQKAFILKYSIIDLSIVSNQQQQITKEGASYRVLGNNLAIK